MPRRTVAAAPLRLLSRKRFRRAWAAGALAGAVRWLEVLAVGWYRRRRKRARRWRSALVLFSPPGANVSCLARLQASISERGDRRVILLVPPSPP